MYVYSTFMYSGIMCPALSNPAKGQVTVNTRTVGGVANYTCNYGYNLTGVEMRMCVQKGLTGQWTEPPTCERELIVVIIAFTMITLSLSC